MNKRIVVSAPGKVILFGEHAVVYGMDAIAASIDLHTTVELRNRPNATNSITLEAFFHQQPTVTAELSLDAISRCMLCKSDFSATSDERLLVSMQQSSGNALSDAQHAMFSMVSHIFAVIIICAARCCPQENVSAGGKDESDPDIPSAGHVKVVPLVARVTSNLPVAAGLGSSASFCVAASAAMLAMFGVIPDDDALWTDRHRSTINQLAFQGEKLVHGNPSGMDNSIVTYGGAVRFSRSSGLIPFPLPGNCRLLIVDSAVPKQTKAMVERVATLYAEQREETEKVLTRIGEISLAAEAILLAGTVAGLSALVRENHSCLRKLEVSHALIEQAVSIAEERGLAAKLTGSGGGGCLYVLLPDGFQDHEIGSLAAAMQSCGFTCYKASLGGRGVGTHVNCSRQ